MIIGIGNDICNVARIESELSQYEDKFKSRLFTEYEKFYADKKPLHAVVRYAQFFAAKEACAKALGTGIAKGVYFKDIEVRHTPDGAPILLLHNTAEEILQKKAKELAKKHGIKKWQATSHLTLSCDASIANAVVILEVIGNE